MTIHNLQAFVGSLWDWGFLDDCFGSTGIRVSDLDGIVERNDWHLVLEGKGPGVPVKRGQRRMFASLVRKGFTVVVIWGRPSTVEHMQVWYPHKAAPQPKTPANNDNVRDVVSRWFRWADANGNVGDAA